MKFSIKRVSHQFGENKQPCSDAVQDRDEWYIEISDLQALMALIDDLGHPLIINKTVLDGPNIKIYDDYNE